jgi:uncharacterized protein YqeY
MSLKQQIISDMTAAMKAQDAARTSTLRMLKAAITNREKEGGGELTDEDVQKLLRSQMKQRRDSVEQFEKAGRQELADKEKAEILNHRELSSASGFARRDRPGCQRSHFRNRRVVDEGHGRRS